MTPRQAFENISARARRLLRYHDGLVNIRQRGMRQDWRASCCQFMRWPQTASIDRVDSKDAVVILRHDSALVSRDFSSDALDDLLRASLTLGVSGLDRYLHERVVKRIVNCLRSRDLHSAQEKLAIPATLAVRMTEAWRGASKGGKKTRPANQLRISLQEALHLRTFQSWREIEEAFELMGITGVTGRLQSAYGVGDIKPTRAQLNSIVQRRHRIVHEGDLVRHKRAGHSRVHPLKRKYVSDSLDFIDTLVGHLESIV
jgi:hypothetical protein